MVEHSTPAGMRWGTFNELSDDLAPVSRHQARSADDDALFASHFSNLLFSGNLAHREQLPDLYL